jgi:hypothetical protein
MSQERSAPVPDSLDDDEPTVRLLAGLFWRASTPLISALLLQACGGDGAAIDANRGALRDTSVHCDSAMRWRPMSALKLSQGVDFVALREHASFDHPFIFQRDAAGVPCAHASDPRVCEAELRRVSVMETDQKHMVSVQGDLVRAYRTLDEMLTLLGTIDTPDEALLLIDHMGLPVGCNDSEAGEATKVSLRDDGYRISTRVPDNCGNPRTAYEINVTSAGSVNIANQTKLKPSGCTPGRRPPNLLARRGTETRSAGLARYFAGAARLEAASVDAFEQLAEELRVFGAPRALREAARRAADDEVRHARITSALAERFGARPEQQRLSRCKLRGRAEVALDNALEGCVSETYSAYLATVQARLATRDLMGAGLLQIARDETRHAAFSWQLAAWLEPGLDAQVRRRISARRLGALTALAPRTA